ncbi:3-phosphoshikimate 1-carboxyvinyltransferase [Salirhabdus euzebyi]|uniref:3-phosphoshikimate 1-carboxyvinyltransferase n=1 Tax=Salirhabdus euzebyi TaxID=394506 RepID=A0A841Q1T6_9BACI|nr:3-phosphoshikimate 1-carboxyvinyltransferase [Salirhabdus euzebyi]MBB6452212.1 3-phosphoshikimate 1-carboxyvinyltransferase [Salirhabdus euzebyi]
MNKKVNLSNYHLSGKMTVPGDKSMSHRAVIFGSLAKGETTIEHFLMGEDCLRTIKAFQEMGVQIEQEGLTVKIISDGVNGLQEPKHPIDFGNSGTTARLLLGVFSGQSFHSVLVGDDSLSKRPMDRVTVPLSLMGAKTDGRVNGKYLPMSIRGGQLKPITYELPVNSAQVKSAILLAGLFTNGKTSVIEPVKTRDHTEKMIGAFGGKIDMDGHTVSIEGGQQLTGTSIKIPGDISSAAFFITAAAITQNSSITISGVGLNETRTGIIDVLKQMGAQLETNVTNHIGDEMVGDITIRTSDLKGTTIAGDMIPRLIDELPLIALAATQAKGVTEIRDAEELRFKETDRIKAVVDVLTRLGANITEVEDGMIIQGGTSLKGAVVPSYGDHRIGMMSAIASLLVVGEVEIENPECINISYPNFFDDLFSIVVRNES